ncbi:golgin subfamily A member 7B isoform X1 [Phasianus colchicus]|uniref:golgin subfamily A member 7B isoform X1 n=1 Tax=Phasianus colchicus TaxID=9054 RepID=UPI00129E53EC|nr:golgin subfamily A member 7B isoform X1 [Phasianus colchicus]
MSPSSTHAVGWRTDTCACHSVQPGHQHLPPPVSHFTALRPGLGPWGLVPLQWRPRRWPALGTRRDIAMATGTATARQEVHSLQELRRSASLATKVFVQRDYSDGTTCQFQTKFPPELESRIERQLFEETVKTLNGFYAEAEKIGGSSYLEGCLACATAYFIFLCMETHYEKVLKKISKYIQEQNEKVYAPRGLLLTDPLERGMRVIEISIYEDRCSSGSSSSGSSSSSSSGGGGR